MPTNKVVRLPRDWLGPRGELVPFGAGTPPLGADDGPADYSGAAGPPPEPVDLRPEAATSKGAAGFPRGAAESPEGAAESPEFAGYAPPSAEDFWGERSAAIHGALQAPGDDHRPADGAPADDAHTPPPPRLARRRVRVRAIPRRRAALASAAAVALAAALVIAVVSAGSPHRSARAARLNVAAILSSGVSKILNVGPPRIVSSQRTGHRSRHPVRRVTHLTPKPPPRIAHRATTPRPAPTYAVRDSAANPAQDARTYQSAAAPPSQQAASTAPPPHPSTSSRASASPTGQAGALGPVSSPNG